MNCRHCGNPLNHTFIDLGFAPPSNCYLAEADFKKAELYYPLKVKVCESCWLVQTEDYADAKNLFHPEYAYFSSTSRSWLSHAEEYTNQIIRKLKLDRESFVIEIASNDGYLLKNFIAANIPCLGIEPTSSTADAAEKIGIPVLREFFSESLGDRLAKRGEQADLIIGNNVYAHVPDINSFTKGMKFALKPKGTITLEFPHLLRLIEQRQFDTIYHEHFSYLSLYTVTRIFALAGLRVWDVQKLVTHGGSLRVFGCHENDPRATLESVNSVLQEERTRGLQQLKTYSMFQSFANKITEDLLTFLVEQKNNGKLVVAYGAAAKGNTLLNYAGVKKNLVPAVFDAAESKQGKFMPGSHIPILSPERLSNYNPDYILILPWNILGEIRSTLNSIDITRTRFVKAVPKLEVLS